ncbi:hypothetical protein WICPIJ_005686, partial [Wickerhamomyces pijperi]
ANENGTVKTSFMYDSTGLMDWYSDTNGGRDVAVGHRRKSTPSGLAAPSSMCGSLKTLLSSLISVLRTPLAFMKWLL